MSKVLLFGAIASVLTLNAYAVSSTVTSQDYVDARDALKQDKLPSKNVTTTIDETEMDVPSIVLYPADGENAGAIGEIGFVTPDIANAKLTEIYHEYDGDITNIVRDVVYGWLIAPVVRGGVDEYAVSGAALGYFMDLKQNKMTCAGWPDGVSHSEDNCWLWYKN